MATEFTPWSAAIGGALIGLAALLLLWSIGRIAGISGIAIGVFTHQGLEKHWRIVFLLGLVLGATAYWFIGGERPIAASTPSQLVLILGGVIVGFGVRLGSGCTSGHGVCGLSRFSKRSFVATGVFMLTAIVTVYIIRHIA